MPDPSLTPKLPPPSALTTLISSTTTTTTPAHSATTHQILHNLQYQHLWTSLEIHDLPTSFPASLISGIPPHRVYTHPDEQLYMVERGLREEDIELERVFVLPTVQGQSWSLGKMAAVFDALPEPTDEDEEEGGVDDENEDETEAQEQTDAEKAAKLAEYYDYRAKARRTEEWGGKRLLLAMIDKGMGGEGTVVYYVVQEGTVKPRQN
ncbi:tRNA-splicing endonuclease subunit Sen15 [Aspergillus crustosus]